MSNIYHVLLTGGVGSRLWPLSRRSKPKQYLDLFANKSLFELAIRRNAAFANGLIVVGNKDNKDLSQKTLQKTKKEECLNITEATPRNTAPAIAFAAFSQQQEDILLVTPADHIIKEGAAYDKAVNEALKIAEEGYIVTFGVKPTKPETGYGYIEFEGETVRSFREKPNLSTAKTFLQQGKFLWNSGMFCFKAGVFLEELKKYEPEVYEQSKKAWENSQNGQLDYDDSMQIPSISVDYAVMERSEKIKVVKADFEWSDMGSFEAVYDYLKESGEPVDENGNMHIGSGKTTFFVGLKNTILVSTENANLVLNKEASQDVKQVYQQLENQKSNLIE